MTTRVEGVSIPDSIYVPLGGGTFEIFNDTGLFQDDYNDDFNPSFDDTFWDENTKNNVTTSFNEDKGFYELDWDGFNNTSADYRIDSLKNFDSTDGYLAFDVGGLVDYQENSTAVNNLEAMFVFGFYGKLEFRLLKSDDKTDQFQIYDIFQDTELYSQTWQGDHLDLKIVLDPSDQIYVYDNGYSSTNYELLTTLNKDVVGHGLFYRMSSNEAIGKTYFKPLETLPVIKETVANEPYQIAIPVSQDIGRDSGRARFLLEPGYPCEYQSLTVYGSGSQNGVESQIDNSLEVLDTSCAKDSMKFFSSDVNEISNDAQNVCICRDEAKRIDDNDDGDMYMELDCFCDGTAQDCDATHVKVEKSGHIVDDYLAAPGMGFDFEDPQTGEVFGRDMEFHRYPLSDSTLELSSGKCHSLNILNYSDEKKIFYGTKYTPISSNQIDIDIDVSKYSSEVEYNLKNISEDTDIDTSVSITSDTTKTYTLDRGRYRLRLKDITNDDGSVIDVYWGDKTNGKVLKHVDTRAFFSDFSGNVPGIDIFFEVKQHQGEYFFYIYDVCNQSWTVEERSTAVDLTTNSFACVPTKDNTVAFLYLPMLDNGVYDNRVDYIKYEEYDLSDNTFVSSDSLFLDESYENYIYAFDVEYHKRPNGNGRDIEGYDFAVQKIQDPERSGSALVGDSFHEGATLKMRDVQSNRDVSDKFHPRKVPNVEQKIDIFTEDDIFENSEPLGGISSDKQTIQMNSVRLLKKKSYDHTVRGSSDGKANIAYTGVRSIELSYDDYYNITTLATVGDYRGVPFIFAKRPSPGKIGENGIGGKYEEIGMPFHYDLGGFLDDVNFGNKYKNGVDYENRERLFFNLSSLSASVGPEGYIYTLACNPYEPDRKIQLGIMEPSMLNESREQWLKLNSTNEHDTDISPKHFGQNRNAYQPEHQFQNIALHNIYNTSGEYTPRVGSIQFDHQYTHLLFGGDLFDLPLMLHGGHQDTFPMRVPFEEMWQPEYQDNSEYEFSGTLSFQDDRVLLSNNIATSMTRTMTKTTVPVYEKNNGFRITHGERSDIGYKYFARMQPDVSTLSQDFEFLTESRFNLYDTEIDGITHSFKIQVRMIEKGTKIHCEWYNNFQSKWVRLGTFDLGDTSVRDCYIMVKQVAYDSFDNQAEFDMMFIVKNRDHVKTLLESGNYQYDYRSNDRDGYIRNSGYIEGASKSATTDEPSSMSLGFLDTNSDDFYFENVYVYETGWGLTEPRHSFHYDSPNSSSTNYDRVVQQIDDLYTFYDARVLTERPPHYQHRAIGNDDSFYHVYLYHWPNGIQFDIEGQKAERGMVYDIGRKVQNTTAGDFSNRLYTMWRSPQATSDIDFWYNSSDLDNDEIVADTFVLTGLNIPKVDIIGANDTSNWNVIDTIDFNRFYIPDDSITYVQNINDSYIVDVENAGWPSGFFEDEHQDYYWYNASSKEITKIVDYQKNPTRSKGRFRIAYQDDPNYNSEDVYIFGSRQVLIRDNEERYQYIGLRFDSSYAPYSGAFELGSFDIGVHRNIPLDFAYNESTGLEEEWMQNVQQSFDHQSFAYHQGQNSAFELSYELMNAQAYLQFEKLLEESTLNRDPFWVIHEYEGAPHQVYLALVDSGAQENLLIDDDQGDYYTYQLALKLLE